MKMEMSEFANGSAHFASPLDLVRESVGRVRKSAQIVCLRLVLDLICAVILSLPSAPG